MGKIKKPPWLYHLRILQKQMFRYIWIQVCTTRFSEMKDEPDQYSYLCKKHQSLLRRKLGDADPQLQENKITNVKLALETMNGIVIKPGETFSFWKLVGKTTEKKGYIPGMLLSQGKVITGVGGGICQLANLLYWLALHTELEVVERHHHSFDPFPDEGRVLPFGSGAGVFYNYVDLRFYNPTNQSFILNVWLTEHHLKGSFYSDWPVPYSYHIKEKNHHYFIEEGETYRTNDIYREVIDKVTGDKVKIEFLIHNCSLVKYRVSPHKITKRAN